VSRASDLRELTGVDQIHERVSLFLLEYCKMSRRELTAAFNREAG